MLRLHVSDQTCNSRYCLPPRTDTVTAEAYFGGAAEAPRLRAVAVGLAQPAGAAGELQSCDGAGPVSPRSPRWPAPRSGTGPSSEPVPMVPLTGTCFGGTSRGVSGVRHPGASSFGTGIVPTFTAAGFLVALIFGAGGTPHPWSRGDSCW